MLLCFLRVSRQQINIWYIVPIIHFCYVEAELAKMSLLFGVICLWLKRCTCTPRSQPHRFRDHLATTGHEGKMCILCPIHHIHYTRLKDWSVIIDYGICCIFCIKHKSYRIFWCFDLDLKIIETLFSLIFYLVGDKQTKKKYIV